MKILLAAVVFFFFCTALACVPSQEQKIKDDDNIIKVDLTPAFEKTEQVNLSLIADKIDYLELEYTENSQITYISQVIFEDNLIGVLDNRAQNLFLFDTLGYFIRNIGTKGKGPGEYISMREFDMKNRRIVFYDSELKKINRYHINGTFINEIPVNNFIGEVEILNGNSFACLLSAFNIY